MAYTNLHDRVRKNVVYSFIGRILAPLIRLSATFVIIRHLSLNDYGVFSVLMALLAYTDIATSLGLPSIYQRFIPELYEKKETAGIKKLVVTGLLLRGFLGLLIISIILLFGDVIGNLLGIENCSRYLDILAVCIFFYLEAQILREALNALFLNKYCQLADITHVTLRTIMIFAVLWMGKSVRGLLIADAIAYMILSATCILWYYLRFSRLYKEESSSCLPLKRMIRFGTMSYFNEVGVTVLSASTDFLVISVFLGPIAVASYAFANQLMRILFAWLPHNLLLELIRPTFFARYIQTGDSKDLRSMFNLLTKFTVFFAFPLAVAMLVLGDYIILYIFGDKYLAATNLLRVVAVFTAINTLIFPIGLVLHALEKPQVILTSKIFAVYNLVADLLVVNTYGIMGIAVVTGSAVLMQDAFCYYFARKYAHLRLEKKNLTRILVNTIFMGGVLLFLRPYITGIVSLFIVCFAGMLFYFAFSIINRSFSDVERDTINRTLGKRIFFF